MQNLHSWTAAKMEVRACTDSRAQSNVQVHAVVAGSNAIANSHTSDAISRGPGVIGAGPSARSSFGARARTSTPSAPSRRVVGAEALSNHDAVSDAADEAQKIKSCISTRSHNRGCRVHLLVAISAVGAAGIGLCLWKQSALWEHHAASEVTSHMPPPSVENHSSDNSSAVCTEHSAESECSEAIDCIWISKLSQEGTCTPSSLADQSVLKQEIGRLQESKRRAVAEEDYLRAKELVKKERAMIILTRDD